MKITVARETEETLTEYIFNLSNFTDLGLTFRFISLRIWQRDHPEAPFEGDPLNIWYAVDLANKNTIKERPEIPDDVFHEARLWILEKIKFDI